MGSIKSEEVLEVYRITLLSNISVGMNLYPFSFRGLQNYTTLKQRRSKALSSTGFRGLQNYTTLKHQRWNEPLSL